MVVQAERLTPVGSHLHVDEWYVAVAYSLKQLLLLVKFAHYDT